MPKDLDKKYRAQKYRREWEKEQWARGWLSSSKNHPGKAYCYVCNKDLAAGKSELIGHTQSSSHIRLMKTVEENRPLAAFIEVSSYPKIKAELNAVALVARKNLSFNFLDQLIETLHFVANDSKAIKEMSCNRTKGTYLMNECLALNAHEKLVAEMKKARGFSILCDKATDITMNKVFCVSVRFLDQDSAEPVTRLYRLLPVKDGDADGLFDLLKAALEKDDIGWGKVSGYASDGENLMQGQNNSLLTRMKAVVPKLFVLKCYCHSFHLVASHACNVLSKTAEQLIHDIYNYFKNSPNRQKSYEEFQHFVECQPHRILKPCQTRWLSVSQCIHRILEQWPALQLFFISEVSEMKSPQAERIVTSLQTPYIKATLEFTDFVLGDLTGLNAMFQSESFKLHRLLHEIERVVKMFCNNFMSTVDSDLNAIDVDDERKWIALESVYAGIYADETMNGMRPHEKESFLKRCRDWYREAVRQILKRIDVSDPVLLALKDIESSAIMKGKVKLSSAGVLATKLPRLRGNSSLQVIDRQWRSLVQDDVVKNGGWEKHGIIEFWKAMLALPEYQELAQFMLEVTALPQSTAAVERTFSKINNNKTKLRNGLAVTTIEAIVKVSERFKKNFEVDERLVNLHSKARGAYMQKYADADLVEITDFE
eukprot:Seg306.6 transcript_id=Seg306.6/GoldUCD/mRNA.D3Y31 product="Zinc finger protein 862" protein_id=Seg306.6/GoldUCD/D3Y31